VAVPPQSLSEYTSIEDAFDHDPRRDAASGSTSIRRPVFLVFVITAYELTGKPLVAFRRRMKKKWK